MAVIINRSIFNMVSYNLFGLNQGKSLLADLCNAKSVHIIMTQEH